MVKLRNIRPGHADVEVDGQVVGWVLRTEVTITDYEGRELDVLLWEGAVRREDGQGVIVTTTASGRRRDAVVRLLDYVRGQA